MKNKRKKYLLEGFTIVEMLVTLILTSFAITLSYSTLTYIQKLFYSYKEQNRFITEYTDLVKRLDYESLKAQTVIEESENKFSIKRDSTVSYLEILDKTVLLKYAGRCDTFHISTKKIKKEYELIKNQKWSNKLLKSLELETYFTKQKFIVYFYKYYESAVKLELEKEE